MRKSSRRSWGAWNALGFTFSESFVNLCWSLVRRIPGVGIKLASPNEACFAIVRANGR